MSFVNIFDNEGDSNQKKLLKKLLEKAKQQHYSGDKLEFVITEIADLILRSRPICRQYKGRGLEGVYLEIYDLVRSLLIEKIGKKCQNVNLINSIDYEWLSQLQKQVFQSAIDDEQLKKLAINAQKCPPNTALRSYALTELVKAIEISNRLCYPHRGLFAHNFYPVIYEEAVVQTMAYICTKIDKYDPERGKGRFLNWVNFKLDKAVLACRRQFDLSHKYQLVSLEEVKFIADPSQKVAMADLLYEYIKQDPTGIFQKTYVLDNPQANFQAIVLSRLSGKAWKEIAKELKVNIPVLSAFYQRNCQKFKTLLHEFLES